MERILVAYDGSAPAGRALERAAGLIGSGELVLLHVMPYIVPAEYTPADVDPEEAAAETIELETVVTELVGRGIAARALPVAGDEFADAADAIVAGAERCQAEAIAIGTRGHGAIRRLALGSVSSRVAERAHCDVLIVR